MVVVAQLRDWSSRQAAVPRSSEHGFLAVSSLLFVASTIITIVWCGPMSAMGMPMPGGWTMSMAFMRMPGQSWFDSAASFLGMWTVMMVAMMLPLLVPMLRRYREWVGVGESLLGRATVVAGAGYFLVWTVVGVAVFPLGVMLTEAEMRWPALSRAVPMATAIVLLIAGAIQFTAWKAQQLATFCEAPARERRLGADTLTALGHGVRLGLQCARSSANLMMILLVTGLMDLSLMAVVTAAIAAERLTPVDGRVARAVGAAVIAVGLVSIARAAGLE